MIATIKLMKVGDVTYGLERDGQTFLNERAMPGNHVMHSGRVGKIVKSDSELWDTTAGTMPKSKSRLVLCCSEDIGIPIIGPQHLGKDTLTIRMTGAINHKPKGNEYDVMRLWPETDEANCVIEHRNITLTNHAKDVTMKLSNGFIVRIGERTIVASPDCQQGDLNPGDLVLFTPSSGDRELCKYVESDGYGMGVLFVDQDMVRGTVAYSKTCRVRAWPDEVPEYVASLPNLTEVFVDTEEKHKTRIVRLDANGKAVLIPKLDASGKLIIKKD